MGNKAAVLEVVRLNDHEPALCPAPNPTVYGFLRCGGFPMCISGLLVGRSLPPDSVVQSGMEEQEEGARGGRAVKRQALLQRLRRG